MQFFDLHCDTLYKVISEDSDINNNSYEVSVGKTIELDTWCQCFAVWIPDSVSADKGMRLFLQAAHALERDVNKYGLTSFDSDLSCNKKYIFTLENAAFLANNIRNVDLLLKHNVKMVTLTWNAENCIGGGADAQKVGLKSFGKECIRVLESKGIVVDLSHASDKTFYDVVEVSTKPIAVSHSNSRVICPHNRNITNDQFVEIIKRNGIVGLNFHKDFLSLQTHVASINDILKHTEHFLSLGGENSIAIGSDFDGADPVLELSDISKIANLYESYLKIGYNEQLVQKIMFNNAYNFFSRF